MQNSGIIRRSLMNIFGGLNLFVDIGGGGGVGGGVSTELYYFCGSFKVF